MDAVGARAYRARRAVAYDFDPIDPFSEPGGPGLELDVPRATPRPAEAPTRAAALPEDPETGLPRRAVQLADYGPPPSIVFAIPYAFSVRRRRRELRAELPRLARLRDVAEQDLQEATLALGHALLEARDHPRAAELGTALKIATARHRQLRRFEVRVEQARDEAAEKIAEIEASIGFAEEAVRPLRTKARAIQAEIVVYQRDFEAAMTEIHEATEQIEKLEKLGDPDPDRRIELEASRTLRRPAADAARAEIETRTPSLTAVEAKVIEVDKEVAKHRAAIAELEAQVAAVEAEVAEESADARATLDAAVVDLADEAVRLRIDHELAPPEARKARLRHDTFAAHHNEHAMHEMALTLYHPRSVKLGWVTLLLLIVGTVAGVGYLIVP